MTYLRNLSEICFQKHPIDLSLNVNFMVRADVSQGGMVCLKKSSRLPHINVFVCMGVCMHGTYTCTCNQISRYDVRV